MDRSLNTLGDVLTAAVDLVTHGVATVVVSMGRYGALLVTPSVTAHAVAPVSSPLSTVGAGDALLAGYLYATGSGSTPWTPSAPVSPGAQLRSASPAAACPPRPTWPAYRSRSPPSPI